MAGQFGLGQGMQLQDRHSARQGIRQLRHQQDIARPGQDKPPGLAPTVYCQLDGREQVRHPLDFVQNHPFGQILHESDGVQTRGLALHVVVETNVGIAVRRIHRQRQRGFPALPRTMDQNDGIVSQGFAQARLDEPRKQTGTIHAPTLSKASAD